MAEIRPDKLDADILAEHGFYPDDFEEFVQWDMIAAKHCGYTISLCVPNGGILGVSFYKRATDESYSLPTEANNDLPGYYDKKGHIKLARKAIDAAMPAAIADQLELVEVA